MKSPRKPRTAPRHPPNNPHDLRRVELLLKEQLDVQRSQLVVQNAILTVEQEILAVVTKGFESNVTIIPGTPRFYAKSELPHDGCCHDN